MSKENVIKDATESLVEEITHLIHQWFDSVYEDAHKDGYDVGFKDAEKEMEGD